MKFIQALSSLLITMIMGIVANTETEFKLIYENMKAKGGSYSFDEIVAFTRNCISKQISTEDIDSAEESTLNRMLLDQSSFHCPPYSSSNSGNATSPASPICSILDVLPGTTIAISDCSSTCVGDQYLRLYDSDSNVEVQSNDDGSYTNNDNYT